MSIIVVGSTLTVSEGLAVIAYRDSLSFSQFRILSEWLGCYRNIHPDGQSLAESSFSLSPRPRSPLGTYSLWQFQLILQNHYTILEQHNILREILCFPHNHTIH